MKKTRESRKAKVEKLLAKVRKVMDGNKGKHKGDWTRVVKSRCPDCGGHLTVYIARPNWARCYGKCGAAFDKNLRKL